MLGRLIVGFELIVVSAPLLSLLWVIVRFG